MRRSTLRELSGMKLYEVEHVCRCSAGELAHGIRHAIVTPLLGQLGHGGEMPDDVLGKLRLAKAFAPRRDWNVAIPDRPAERFEGRLVQAKHEHLIRERQTSTPQGATWNKGR